MSERLYFEQKVADRLGIARRDLKSVRDEILEKEKGWRIHGRDVALTETGLQDVLKELRLADRELDFTDDLVPIGQAEKKEGAVGAEGAAHRANGTNGDGLTLLTVQRNYPNPRLLVALTPSGELVTVGVKSNLNFRPRMTLKGRLVRAGRYEMEGRCPRFPGRY